MAFSLALFQTPFPSSAVALKTSSITNKVVSETSSLAATEGKNVFGVP